MQSGKFLLDQLFWILLFLVTAVVYSDVADFSKLSPTNFVANIEQVEQVENQIILFH